eukprot:4743296-Pleurochrysis_carterae.AAC.1
MARNRVHHLKRRWAAMTNVGSTSQGPCATCKLALQVERVPVALVYWGSALGPGLCARLRCRKATKESIGVRTSKAAPST